MASTRRVLIAAHPRSGTLYICRCLETLGLDVKHEKPATISVGYQEMLKADDYDLVIHQVRHPLNVIRSVINCAQTYKNMFKVIGQEPPKSYCQHRVTQSMWTWIHFNRAIAERAAWRFRIEDIDDEWPRLMQSLEVGPAPLPPVDRRTHHRRSPYRDMTSLDLWNLAPSLYEEMMTFAKDYGYEPGNVTQPCECGAGSG